MVAFEVCLWHSTRPRVPEASSQAGNILLQNRIHGFPPTEEPTLADPKIRGLVGGDQNRHFR